MTNSTSISNLNQVKSKMDGIERVNDESKFPCEPSNPNNKANKLDLFNQNNGNNNKRKSSNISNSNSTQYLNRRIRGAFEIFRNRFSKSSSSSSNKLTKRQLTVNENNNIDSKMSHKKANKKEVQINDKNLITQKHATGDGNFESGSSSSSMPFTLSTECQSFTCKLCYEEFPFIPNDNLNETDEENKKSKNTDDTTKENEKNTTNFLYIIDTCKHSFCIECLRQYLRILINESRVSISCPQCNEKMHPIDIYRILKNESDCLKKYEDFTLRRMLASIQDTRWCPAPDCTYAVIATGCANCPQLFCQRPNCNTSFCYHCKQLWHPNLTCEDAANDSKLIRSFLQRSFSLISTGSSLNLTSTVLSNRSGDYIKEEIKKCPKCQALIVKMDDGSCNHITCSVCGCEFCWLCMKEISDLHYLSPSGCTFWGKKPWSRKKKILWQLGTLIGAPVGIALIAGVAVPAILIGLPIWAGRKVYVRYKSIGSHKRNLLVAGTVIGSLTIAPIVATLVVGIGVPILLFYVYGVVPISLCRSGGCGVTKNNNGGVRFAFDEEEYENTTNSLNNNIVNINNVNSQITKEKKTVTIPISAIEPKVADSILVSSNTVPDVTPVLVTITMANNKENNNHNNNGSSQNINKKANKKSSKRNKSNIKKDNTKFRKAAIETNTLCGSVEMSSQSKLKSNKSKRKSNDYESSKCNTIMNSSSGFKLKEEKTIAGEAGIAAVSALKKLNHINENLNTDDLRNNLFSTTISSSSQNLLNDDQKSNDESTSIRNNNNTNTNKTNINSNNKNLKEFLNKIVNPSIGETSIGAFTITSANSGAENNYYEYDEYCQDQDGIMYEDTCTNENDLDHKSSSNKPVTSGSNCKLSDSVSINTTATNNGNQTNANKHHANIQQSKIEHDFKSIHSEPKTLTFYTSDIDNYSVSIFSEKSVNPSMAAFAGSIKYSLSTENINDKI